MYSFYLDKLLLPVAPGSMTIGFSSQNKTINLINEGEINMLKSPGLLEISFDALLPNMPYPFAVYKDGFQGADKFIEEINKLKKEKKPFQFIVVRTRPDGTPLFNTNIKAAIEEYELEEDAEEGFDVKISLKLKQYKAYGSKKIKIEKPPEDKKEEPPKAEEVKEREGDEKKIMIGSDVTVNGQLHRDSYGKGPGQTKTNYKGKVNLINEKGSHPYHITTPEGSYLGWVTKGSVNGI